MRILGIDPGTAIMGWGVIDEQGGTPALIECGALTTAAGLPQQDRLLLLYDGLQAILQKHVPQAAAIEVLTKNRCRIWCE